MKTGHIIIRKKMLFPSKKQIVHQWRSSWIKTFVITNDMCESFFSQIKTDAQFALFLKNNFGIGCYFTTISEKGRSGFRTFLKVECMEDGYIRLKRRETDEDKEQRELFIEKRRMQRQFKSASDPKIQENLAKDLAEINDNLDFTKEIKSLSHEVGPYPYLKSIKPVYGLHSYLETNTIEEENRKVSRGFKENLKREQRGIPAIIKREEPIEFRLF
jgi:hypothetical protein